MVVWHDRAKRYAKGPLEMDEIASRRWPGGRGCGLRLTSHGHAWLSFRWSCWPVPLALSVTIAAAGAWPGAADVLLRTILFLPVGGLVGFLTFVLLSVCRPYVPADANQVRGRSATSRTPAQRH